MTTQDPAPVLAACPFCGAAASELMWRGHFGCSDNKCGAYGANLSAEQWNRRSPLPERDAVVETLPTPTVIDTFQDRQGHWCIRAVFFDPQEAATVYRALKAEGVEASPGAEGGGRNELAQPMTASRSPATKPSDA